MIKSISFDEQEIIRNILELHIKGSIELDPTYSKGNFYKKGLLQPIYKFDISPQTEDTIKADCRKLPIESDSINCIMFDPPFLATTGQSLLKKEGNIINKRFGVYRTEKELFDFYVESLKEFYRVLKSNKFLIFKCQDKVSSGKQYWSHVFIINEAEKIGFYCKDLFIYAVNNRIVANWQKNQQHARKYHSYFLVFQKK